MSNICMYSYYKHLFQSENKILLEILKPNDDHVKLMWYGKHFINPYLDFLIGNETCKICDSMHLRHEQIHIYAIFHVTNANRNKKCSACLFINYKSTNRSKFGEMRNFILIYEIYYIWQVHSQWFGWIRSTTKWRLMIYG